MGDWAVLRLDLDNPDESELVKIVANVPLNWQKYLKTVSEEVGLKGRYVAANILYSRGVYYPEDMKGIYELVEKESRFDADG